MKKQLMLLPFLSALALCGCGSVKDSDLPPHTLREFEGYKLVTKVKNGKRYLLGDYRYREDLMRFANGDYHWDSGKSYPFYMGTVAGVGSTKEAAEFELKFTNKSKGEFSLQCFTKDASLPWNKKYVGVYAAMSSNDNKVMSIALLDSPTQKTYIDRDENEWAVSGIFKFYEKVDDLGAYAPGIPFQYPDVDPSAEHEPKFFGSSMVTEEDWEKGEPDYISMDCKRWEEALRDSRYNLAHLYEKK